MKHSFQTVFGDKLGLPSATIHPLVGRCFLVKDENADAIVAKFKELESRIGLQETQIEALIEDGAKSAPSPKEPLMPPLQRRLRVLSRGETPTAIARQALGFPKETIENNSVHGKI